MSLCLPNLTSTNIIGSDSDSSSDISNGGNGGSSGNGSSGNDGSGDSSTFGTKTKLAAEV